MELLCDELLRGLGRWLRAAGHDTAIAGAGAKDRALLAMAEREARLLLTRDRHLAEVAGPRIGVCLLVPNTLDEQAWLLRDTLGLDWLLAPFTRCTLDNTVLVPAAPQLAAAVPESARRGGDELRACPSCSRVYWPGSHVRRMAARLEGWQGPEACSQLA